MDAIASVVWFKRDLRLQDHAALVAACEHAGDTGGPLVLLIMDEPDDWSQPDRSPRHRLTWRLAVADLQLHARKAGADLWLRRGPATETLHALQQQQGAITLFSHEETGNGWSYKRDKQVAQWCRDHAVPWFEFSQNGVQRGLQRRQGWARTWEARMAEPRQPPPDLRSVAIHPPADWRCEIAIPEHDSSVQSPAREMTLNRLEVFLHTDGRDYQRGISSPLRAVQASSRLSVGLCWGTVSLREITQRSREHRLAIDPADPGMRGWRASLASFDKRLHWHCHFMQKLETQPALEHACMHPAAENLDRRCGPSTPLAAWQRGETGWPFVDACMRMLNTTGWLNFRMRAMLMAVASYHLWLDWRDSGLHLARQFADYEPGIHWPQVQMQSGTTGINTYRIYNPTKQGHDHDPDAAFIARWVPELARLPAPMRHTPWAFPDDDLARHGLRLNVDYPRATEAPEIAARRARQRMSSLRQQDGFSEIARDLQQRLGSQANRRRRTPRSAGRTTKRTRQQMDETQKSFF